MLRRKPLNPPQHIYPIEPWRIVEKHFYPRFLSGTETIFSTANGYLGMRGCFEEGHPIFENGTFINGFYESWQITYPEIAYGFSKAGQTMVNVTDAKIIKLYVDDEPFSLPEANLVSFERALDMRAGTLDRKIVWEMPSGKRLAINSRRLVSFEHRHLAAISYEVTVLNDRANVIIASEIRNDPPPQYQEEDPRRARGFQVRVLHPQVHYRKNRRVVLGHITGASKMTLACGIDHLLETDCTYTVTNKAQDNAGKVVFSCDAQPGVPIRLTKYIAYHTSSRMPAEELCDSVERSLNRAVAHGFPEILASQGKYLEDFWNRSDVQIEGHHSKGHRAPEVQQAIRFNLFQILQAAARAGNTGIPAKGLTAQVEALRRRNPDRFHALAEKIGLHSHEVQDWQRAAAQMYIPYSERLRINPQDDNFLDKQVWDFANTPPEQYPLLLHFHPLEIYRRQVIKQADVVLAMFLLGQKFSPEKKQRNFDYYDPLTTGDSSLSVGIQSILAAEIGYLDKAVAYAHYAVLMDLGDVEGNVRDGCHIASMGASWMVLVNGFGGMRDYDGVLSFNPRLPEALKKMRFPLTYRGQVLEVEMTPETATYLLREGSGLTITHQGQEIKLAVGKPVEVKIQPEEKL